MQSDHYAKEIALVRCKLSDDDADAVDSIMYTLHKLSSTTPNKSVAECVFEAIAGEVDVTSDECIPSLVDFFILKCLKEDTGYDLSELSDHDLRSFYNILGGRIDFVDTLYECDFSMDGLVDAVVANNDIQLITHILDNKMCDVRDIVGILTTDIIAGDMTPMFNFLVTRGALHRSSEVNDTIDLFIMTDNVAMMRWMDMRGMLSHDKSKMNNRFRHAVLCESLDVARWLAENGNYESDASLVKVVQNGERYEEIMTFLNELYSKK